MKYIWLGIKDYCKDCWHDWLKRRVAKIGSKVYDCGMCENEQIWFVSVDWKEGNLRHYISQRKVAERRKNARHNDVL